MTHTLLLAFGMKVGLTFVIFMIVMVGSVMFFKKRSEMKITGVKIINTNSTQVDQIAQRIFENAKANGFKGRFDLEIEESQIKPVCKRLEEILNNHKK